MSAGDEDFELLVSSEDYLKLQAKCHELQTQHTKLHKQNQQLSLKIFGLKQENLALQKNIASLNDSIKYLSLKGIEMSKTLILLQDQGNNLKISMVQSERQMGIKYKNALSFQKQLQTKLHQMIVQNSKIKEQLKYKLQQLQNILGVQRISRHIQVSPIRIQACVITSQTNQDLENLLIKNKQKQQKIIQFQNRVKNSQITINQHRRQIKQFEAKLIISSQELKKLKDLNSNLQLQNSVNIKCKQKLTLHVNALNQQLKTCSEKYMKLSQQKQVLNKNMQNQKHESKLKQQEFNKKTSLLNSQIQLIQKQLNDLQAQKQSSGQALSKQKQQMQNLQIQNQNLLGHIQKLSERTKILQKQKQQNSSKYTLLHEQLKKKQLVSLKQRQKFSSEILSLQNQIKVCIENQQKIQTKLNESEQKFKNLTQINLKITQQLTAAQQNADLLQKQIQINNQKSNQQLDELLKQYEIISKQNQNLKVNYNQSISKNSLLNQQALALNDQIQKLKLMLKEKMEVAQNLKSQCQNYKQLLKQLQNKVKQSKQMSSQNVNKYLTQLQQQNQKNALLKNQHQMLIAEFDKLENTYIVDRKSSQKKIQQIQQNLQQSLKRQNLQKAENLRLKQEFQLLKIKVIQLYQVNKNIEGKKQLLQLELNSKIKELKNEIQVILESKRTMQMQYDDIIAILGKQQCTQVKSKSKSAQKKDVFKQIQAQITEYFTTIGLNLYEQKLPEEDIECLLLQQEKAIVMQIKQAIAPFRKKKINHQPMCSY